MAEKSILSRVRSWLTTPDQPTTQTEQLAERRRARDDSFDAPPETQLQGTFRTLWKPATLNEALTEADGGNLELVADLCRALMADDRIMEALDKRIYGVEKAPLDFELDDPDADGLHRLGRMDLEGDARADQLAAVGRDWYEMMTTGRRRKMRAWGMLAGVCPVYVRDWREIRGRQVPICEAWNPRWLQYRWQEREWYILTQGAYRKLSDQPTRWFLYCPFGDPYDAPWVDGYWYRTATWWLLRSYGIQDMGQFSQSHASPKWFMEAMEGHTILRAAKREALQWLARIAQRAAIYIPQGFKVTSQTVSSSSAHQIYPQEIELASKYLTQALLGSDSTTDKEASYASSATGARMLYALWGMDAEAESDFWHHGPLHWWTAINYGQAADVPWPVRDVAPPEDTKAQAETQEIAARAWAALVDSGGVRMVDGQEFLSSYFPIRAALEQEAEQPTILNGAQVKAAVDIIAQMAMGVLDSEAASTMLEALLGVSPEAAARIVGGAGSLPAPAEQAMAELQAHGLALLAEKSGKTHFPQKGDDRAVSLRNSEYDTFDPDYADDLKANWPEVWKLGGSSGKTHSGDSQYELLRPVVDRGGIPESDEEEEAIRVREAWAARHYANKRIKGVVALAKWFVVGAVGEKEMKAVIEDRKALVRKRRTSKQTETWLLAERPRDVRQHLHDGIEYVDDITAQLNERTPELVKPAAQQIMTVIERAGGYEEARQQLLVLYPQLERRPLRDALTGATLLAQAAGRLTAGREGGKE